MKMESTVGDFRTQLLRLMKGEIKSFVFKKCQLEFIQGDHPLPRKMIEGLDCASYSYIRVSGFNKKASDNIEESHSVNRAIDEEASVGGSPLSFNSSNWILNCTQMNSPKEQCVKSVASVFAREVISLYNLSCWSLLESKDPVYPIWVYCSGLDGDSTAFLSSYFRPLLSDVSRVVIDGTLITVEGPFPFDHSFPSVADLLGKSLYKNHGQLKYFSQYALFESCVDNSSDMEFQNLGSVDVLFRWGGEFGILAEPPPVASATLSVNIRAGDPRSAAHHLYVDLITLQGIVDGLADGLVKWAVHDNAWSLTEQVKQFLEDQKKIFCPDFEAHVGPSTDDDSVTLRDVLVRERLDLDFTEALWMILRNCTSYRELTDNLQYILITIQEKELQPLVHKSNNSHLARIIRQSLCDELTHLPLLEGIAPVEFLADIGLEKLFRDYSAAFLGSDLLTGGHLLQFFDCGKSGTAVERFCRLEKLHLVLEIVTLLDQSLALPRATLSSVARKALKYYERNEIKATDTFSVPVSMLSVASVLSENVPKLWKASLSNERLLNDAEAAVMLTSDYPFLHTASKPSSTAVSSNVQLVEQRNLKSSEYFLTVVGRTQTLM